MSVIRKEMDPEETRLWLQRHFIVNPNEGNIVWIRPPKNHPRMMGKEAGSFRKVKSGKRYCHIKKDGKCIKRGWLIFLWCHGKWPQDCLDHIDGNSENDRIGNLREATVTQNAWNHKGRSKISDLPMGVRVTKNGRYQARIACRKKMYHLGCFDTPEEAESVYLENRKEMFGEYA